MLQSERIVAFSRRLSEASQEHWGHRVGSGLSFKEGTGLFLGRDPLWWSGLWPPVWICRVLNIHQARNVLRGQSGLDLHALNQTDPVTLRHYSLGYGHCKRPEATLILCRAQSPAESSPAVAGTGLQPLCFKALAAGVQIHQGIPLRGGMCGSRETQRSSSASIRWAGASICIMHPAPPAHRAVFQQPWGDHPFKEQKGR